MAILITGATGMVGTNLLEHPWIQAHEVQAPTREQLDLADFDATRRYLAEHRPESIVHCAGKVGGIQANIAEPLPFLQENLDMGRNLVVAAREAGVRRLLNLGSTCMYPADQSAPIREEQLLGGKLEPTNEAYALAKLAVAKLCELSSAGADGLCYKTAIPCNLFGRYDHFDAGRSHLLAAAIAKIHGACAAGDAEVEIWGDGEARREFMSAADLADFIVYAMERLEQMPGLINVGPGVDYSVNDYYREVARVVGFSGGFRHDLGRPAGTRRKLSDVSRLRQFGWAPRLTLEQGIEDAYRYYLEICADG